MPGNANSQPTGSKTTPRFRAQLTLVLFNNVFKRLAFDLQAAWRCDENSVRFEVMRHDAILPPVRGMASVE